MSSGQYTIGSQIDLAYGKSLPAHTRISGDIKVYGSNGVVGTHNIALISGPGIVVGRKGSVGEVVFSKEPFWPIDTTYYVVNKEKHDWRFLFHLLRGLGLTKLNSHTAVPGLNREDVYSIEVFFPEIEEQKKIAEVLDAIEFSIKLHDEKREILDELGDALHQKLLLGKISTAEIELFSRNFGIKT